MDAPAPVDDLAGFWRRILEFPGLMPFWPDVTSRSVFRTRSELAGVADFPDFLGRLDGLRFIRFSSLAKAPSEIAVARPFYTAKAWREVRRPKSARRTWG